MMTIFRFFLLALAAWRLTSLFVDEDGPFDVFIRLRVKAGMKFDLNGKAYPTTFLSGLLSCVWCASVWVGGFAALFSDLSQNIASYFITALALSALVILIDRMVTR